ncbi:hypothetical protein LAZ67_23001439, partial [Cordylochernes scorpioides]
MKRSLEQRYAIKFCAFKEGRKEVADEPRSGRPTTARTDENVDRVLEVLRTDQLCMEQKSSPRPKKARMSKSRIKTMIIVFFDIRGIVHCEFVPQGQTVNSAFYLEVLRRLKRRIARVRTDIKDTVKLYHDNATSHTAFIITNFLARSNTPMAQAISNFHLQDKEISFSFLNWFNEFKFGKTNLEDELCSGRPPTAVTQGKLS